METKEEQTQSGEAVIEAEPRQESRQESRHDGGIEGPDMYDVLLCDPPWAYRDINTGGSMKSGSLAKYPTMSTEDLRLLWAWLKPLVSRDAVLFLWATSPMKPEAFEVIRAWGFTYRSTIYWDKVRVEDGRLKESRLGMGHWYRGQVEELLVCTRGRFPAFRCQRRNVIRQPATGHSHKPLEAYELIEMATLCRRRLELFATARRDGWEAVGFELDGLDIRNALEILRATINLEAVAGQTGQ